MSNPVKNKSVLPKQTEEVKKAVEQLKELNAIQKIAEQVKDNIIKFTHKDITYRVRQTNFKEEEEIRKVRNRIFIELLDEPGMELRETVARKLKNKGINIDEIDRKIKLINKNIESTQKQLAPIENEKIANNLVKEIENLFQNLSDLVEKKSELLEFCIENLLINHMNNYLVYLVLEKEVNKVEKTEETIFVRAFKSYETFMECKDKVLLVEAIRNISYLLKEEGE